MSIVNQEEFDVWTEESKSAIQEQFWAKMLGGTWVNDNNEQKLSHDIIVQGYQIDIEAVHIGTDLSTVPYFSIPMRKILCDRESKSRFFIKYDAKRKIGFVADLQTIRDNIFINSTGEPQIKKTYGGILRILRNPYNSGAHVKNTIKSNSFFRIPIEEVNRFNFVSIGNTINIKDFISCAMKADLNELDKLGD